jgi:hypothetical protein
MAKCKLKRTVIAPARLGVLHTASFVIQDHISSGALEPLFTEWCGGAIPLHVVYPPNWHLNNKVRVFVDWIAELFGKNDLIEGKSTLPDEMCSAWTKPAMAEIEEKAAPEKARETVAA